MSALATGILTGLACTVIQLTLTPEYQFIFFERDVSLAFPVIDPATVPEYLLLLLAVGIPVAAFVSASFSRVLTWTFSFASLKCLAFTFAVNKCVTDFLKVYVSRPRPNFYALCDYAGFRTKFGGNFSAFEAAMSRRHGEFDRLGDDSLCLDASGKSAAFRSFPSGHSSTSFAGLAFLSMCIMELLFRRKSPVLPELPWVVCAAASSAPLFLAFWIASTRVKDYWHHGDDVLCGALIGFVAALLGFLSLLSSRPRRA